MREDELVKQILAAANKHPNSAVSKLIYSVQNEKTQRNVVLLLIELADHAEYANDFNISLGYHLDLYDRLDQGRTIVLNEAGLLLLNATKIYGRRVDYVHELVLQQIMSISSADTEGTNAKQNGETSEPTPVKRVRKRLLNVTDDPFEVNLVPKKIRKITEEKRFAKPPEKTKPAFSYMEMEDHVHPSLWQHSRIADMDNEDVIDTKRNYKLFTYHVEHRYNTVVPDINFRLHFKVKDYLNQEDDGDTSHYDEEWPPDSDEFVQKYLRVEDLVFDQEVEPHRKRRRLDSMTTVSVALNHKSSSEKISKSVATLDPVQNSNVNKEENKSTEAQNSGDSALGNSLQISCSTNDESGMNVTTSDSVNTANKSADNSTNIANDSALGESITSNPSLVDKSTEDPDAVETRPDSRDNSPKRDMDIEEPLNFNEIRVRLPHLDDEGVFLCELDEHDLRMLSPTVMATDVFPSVVNKENLTLIVDDEIKALFNICDEETKVCKKPAKLAKAVKKSHVPLVLNILRIPESVLFRRALVVFKLTKEFDLFKKTRSLKRTRCAEERVPRKFSLLPWFSLSNTNMEGVPMTPPPSPGHSGSGFLGFSDVDGELSQDLCGFDVGEGDACSETTNKFARLSRDSGVGGDVPQKISTCCLDTIVEENSNECNPEAEAQKDAVEADEKTPLNSETMDNSQTNQAEKEAKLNDSDPFVKDAKNSASVHSRNYQTELDDPSTMLELNQSKTKIQKWHAYLQPMLAKARDRHHFDVFQIGSEMMDQITNKDEEPSSSTRNTSKTFQDVMENKDESYVSRYFLSALLLANQGNIAIEVDNKSSEQPTAWHDIHLKLVSTKRHVVAIEDNIGMIGIGQDLEAGPKAGVSMATSTPLRPIAPPLPLADSPVDESMHCVKSRQMNSKNKVLDVNLSFVRPLQRIEKVSYTNDDADSGIFSREESTV